MLRIKQTIKSDWLAEHLSVSKIGTVFPAWHMIEVKEFDDDTAGDFDTDVWGAVNDNQRIIPVIVDSFGGQIYSLNRMLDTIAAAKKEGIIIMTIGKSKMMSCGSVLVAAGTKGYRYTQPTATMLIHEASSGSRGKKQELQSDAAETDRLNTQLLQQLAIFADKPKKFFVDLIHDVGHADLFVPAKEMVSLGLIDIIGEPVLNMTLTMDVEITRK